MNKLAIVGTHPRTREQAPFDDPTYDIWVFNEAPQADWCKRWDACFQLHKPEVYTSRNNFVRADHWQWLQQPHFGKTIYMQEDDGRVPNGERYPLDEIIADVPGASLKWFKSSAAYALALALWMGYEVVELYGLDMASNTEYGYQLPNYQYWVGVLMGAGVDVRLVSNEQYFTGLLYGYEGEIQINAYHFDKRIIVLEDDKKRAEWVLKKLNERMTEALADGKHDKVRDLVTHLQNASQKTGEVDGALDEARRYGGRADPIPRQEYERRAATAQRDGEEKRQELWIKAGEAQYVWNIWRQTSNPNALAQLKQFMAAQMALAYDVGARGGTYTENIAYMTYVDELVTAAGGQKTIAAIGA